MASALYPLVEEAEPLEESLNQFKSLYFTQRDEMYSRKLGINPGTDEGAGLIEGVLHLLEKTSMDMTLFWRNLSKLKVEESESHLAQLEKDSYLHPAAFKEFHEEWKLWLDRLGRLIQTENKDEQERKAGMNEVNPKYVLRNYMAQLAIEAAEKEDYSLFHELFAMLQAPYDEQPEFEKWFAKRPDWALNKVGSSMLSCSS